MAGAVRKGLTIAAVAGLAAAALVYAFMPRPVPADLTRVTRGPLTVTIDDEGMTRVKEVYVVSAPIAGRVLRIERHVGDPVTAGETVLATIRPIDPTFLDIRSRRQAEAEEQAAEAAQQLAQAELDEARAELAFARTELDRARALAPSSTISKRALDRAALEYETAKAKVAAAEATLRVKSSELETARAALIEPGRAPAERRGEACCVDVRAPVDGRVLQLLQESEAVIGAGDALIEIGDPHDLEVVVDLLSTDAVKVRQGAEVLIEEWGGDGTLKGRVRRVEPYGFTKVSALGIEEQRVNVIIDFIDPSSAWETLGHGFRVEARIVVWQAAEVTRIPVSALFREGEAWMVFAVIEGRARRRPVVIGRRNDREAEVLDGLQEGEEVVLYPSDKIRDGVRLVPRPAS